MISKLNNRLIQQALRFGSVPEQYVLRAYQLRCAGYPANWFGNTQNTQSRLRKLTTSGQRLATTMKLNKVFPSQFEVASLHRSRAGAAISVNVAQYHYTPSPPREIMPSRAAPPRHCPCNACRARIAPTGGLPAPRLIKLPITLHRKKPPPDRPPQQFAPPWTEVERLVHCSYGLAWLGHLKRLATGKLST